MKLETWISEAKDCIDRVSENPERYGVLLFFFDSYNVTTYTCGDLNIVNLLEALRKIRGKIQSMLSSQFLDREEVKV